MTVMDPHCSGIVALGSLGDAQLLARFGSSGDSSAFEVLVRRHGPMVRGVVRAILRHEADTDDVFQATFVILARRAESIRDADRLGPWLARVARRLAWRARADQSRRRDREQPADPIQLCDLAGPVTRDLESLEGTDRIRAEVERLPESQRVPVLLTYWQGRSYEQVADELQWPIGTVRSRLHRARATLRTRLRRLGFASTLMAWGSTIGARASTSVVPVSESLIRRTVHAAASAFNTSSSLVAVGSVPAAVLSLFHGEMAMSYGVARISVVLGSLVMIGAVMGSVFWVANAPAEVASAPQPATAYVEAPPEPPTAPENLLSNPGFEQGDDNSPSDWSRGSAVTGVQFEWARDEAHEGASSLKLSKSVNRYFPIAQWFQAFEVQGAPRKLRVSAWVKAKDVTKVTLDAQFYDEDENYRHEWVAYVGAKQANDPPTTHDWTRYEGVVEIPRGTKSIVIAPQIYGPGTVWFDEIVASYE